MATDQESEHRFQRYLNDNSYAWTKLDEGAPVEPTPDYRIERDGAAAIVEVKEFTTTQLARRLAALGSGGTVIGDDEQSGPVRRGRGASAACAGTSSRPPGLARGLAARP